MRPIEYIRDFDKASYLRDWRKAEEIIYDVMKIYFGSEYLLNMSTINQDIGMDFVVENLKQDFKIGISTKIRTNGRKIALQDLSRDIVMSILSKFDKVLFITNGKYTSKVYDLVGGFALLEMQILDIAYLKDWAKNYENDLDPVKADYEKQVIKQSQYFINQIANDENYLKYIEWRELERIVGEMFSGLGFDAEVTQCSKDGGKDVLLYHQGKKYLIEIKDWSGKRVGQKSVNKFLQVIFREEGEKGLFLSTSGFCDNAFETLTVMEKEKLLTGDSSQIVDLAKLYVRKNNGVYLPEVNLDKLFEKYTKSS